jgi:hypothetical protein
MVDCEKLAQGKQLLAERDDVFLDRPAQEHFLTIRFDLELPIELASPSLAHGGN